jgi:hypothetical protein
MLFWPVLLIAQTVKSSVNRDTILVGEPIRLSLLAAGVNTRDLEVKKIFQLPDSAMHFEIINKGVIDSAIRNGYREYSQIYTITYFTGGEHLIPPFPVIFKNKKYHSFFTITAAPIIVYVKPTNVSALSDYHDVTDIITPSHQIVAPPNNQFIWAIIAIVIVCFVFLTIIRKRRKAKKGNNTGSFKYTLGKLLTLEKNHKKDIDFERGLYQTLYRVLNHCFSVEFDKNIKYYTSEEWINYFNTLPVQLKLKEDFASLIKRIDAVRFGKNESIKADLTIISSSRTLLNELLNLKNLKLS